MKICTFNVENLFLCPTTTGRMRKSPEKTQWLARVIQDIDADIYLLVEVGGQSSLDIFNKQYLQDQYHTSLIRGNSDRGIELGYLVHKRLPYSFEHLTHRNRPLNFLYPHQEKMNQELLRQGKKVKYESELLSRDIAELRVKDDSGKLLCILLGVHLKSKLDDTGMDFNGNKRRAAELKLLVKTYQALQKSYSGHIPVFITGDFNGLASREHEDAFNYLYEQTDLNDVGDLLGWDEKERATFMLFDRTKKPVPLQLDYFFMEKNLKHLIDAKHSGVYRFRKDNVLPLPQTPYNRAELPSDHYPLVVSVSL